MNVAKVRFRILCVNNVTLLQWCVSGECAGDLNLLVLRLLALSVPVLVLVTC